MLLGNPNIHYTKPGGIGITEGGMGSLGFDLPSMDDAMTWGKEQAKGAAGSAGQKALAKARGKGGSALDKAQRRLEQEVHKRTGISIAEKKARVEKGKKKADKKAKKARARAAAAAARDKAPSVPKAKPNAADEIITKVKGNKAVVAGAAAVVLGGLWLVFKK
tara:strand:+ start:1349 stop:1837 length:489 start_codon:yes stop_codon:yes gene_type:complete